MITISPSKLIAAELNSPKLPLHSPTYPPSCSPKIFPCPHFSASVFRKRTLRLTASCSKSKSEAELSADEDEWLKRLPDKAKPLYAHSLPCVEAWLRNLGFYQSIEDRAIWFIELPEWHAQLSLDVTDLYIRSVSFPVSPVIFPSTVDK